MPTTRLVGSVQLLAALASLLSLTGCFTIAGAIAEAHGVEGAASAGAEVDGAILNGAVNESITRGNQDREAALLNQTRDLMPPYFECVSSTPDRGTRAQARSEEEARWLCGHGCVCTRIE